MAEDPVAKRIKMSEGMWTLESEAVKSLFGLSKAIVRLVGDFLTLGEFINLRSSCKFAHDANRLRWLRWKYVTKSFRGAAFASKCQDNYNFILSPFLLDEYHREDPQNVPRTHYPSPRDCALASIRATEPSVLARIPLRLMHAFGGLAAISQLPSRPLQPEHFVLLTSTMQVGNFAGRVAAGYALSFTEDNTAHPVELFYNTSCTALVLRLRLTPENHGPIFVMWYTCTIGAVAYVGRPVWYCELQHEKGVKYFYKSLSPSTSMVTSLSFSVLSGPCAVQVSQNPQSPLSFLRPAYERCVHLVRDDEGDLNDQGRLKNFNDQHSTPWDATDFLRTLILGGSVCSTSLTHKECFVRLAVTNPTGEQLLVSLLDWAHTQIQLPLILQTTSQFWGREFLEPALRAYSVRRPPVGGPQQWCALYVPLTHYQHLCDDEHYPLTQHDAEARMAFMMDNYEYSASDALHALFSKGSRGFDVRTATFIACKLLDAVHGLPIVTDRFPPFSPWDHEAVLSWIASGLYLTKIGCLHLEENNDLWWKPLLREVIWKGHVLYDQSEEVEDHILDDLGFHDPVFMCDICVKRHFISGPWRDPFIRTLFTGSTHATRARLLRRNNFEATPVRNHDILCVADPDFSEHLGLFLDYALHVGKPIHFLLYVPAYQSATAQRNELLAELAFKYNVHGPAYTELSAGRYYLHPVGMVLDPRSATCFVCDTHRAHGDYNYIAIPPRLANT